MSDRRLVILGLAAMAATSTARAAAAPVGEQQALAALLPWIEAVASGDRAAVEPLLAPEFQILRSDGTGYDKAAYLMALPEHRRVPEVRDAMASGEGGSLVIRYAITVDGTVRGQTMRGTAPRLSAMRKDGGNWLMVAHANFAPLG